MTCVIAAKCSNGALVMAADHAFTDKSDRVFLGGYCPKIRLGKNFIAGYAGGAVTGAAVLHYIENEELFCTDDEFSTFEISEMFNRAYSELNILKSTNDTCYLVAYHGQVFHVYQNLLCQMTTDDCDAIGSNPALFCALYKINVTKSKSVAASLTQTVLDASIVCTSVKCFSAGPTVLVL